MSASEPGNPAPSFTRRNELLERVEGAVAIAARHETFRAAIDHSLSDLRKECARTLSLIRTLRASPLYNRASTNQRYRAGW